jgi:hypothetical protein
MTIHSVNGHTSPTTRPSSTPGITERPGSRRLYTNTTSAAVATKTSQYTQSMKSPEDEAEGGKAAVPTRPADQAIAALTVRVTARARDTASPTSSSLPVPSTGRASRLSFTARQ